MLCINLVNLILGKRKMVDISKCEGKECPIKETCYRYISKPDKFWRSYISTPYNKETNTCDYYWKTEIKKNVNHGMGNTI